RADHVIRPGYLIPSLPPPHPGCPRGDPGLLRVLTRTETAAASSRAPCPRKSSAAPRRAQFPDRFSRPCDRARASRSVAADRFLRAILQPSDIVLRDATPDHPPHLFPRIGLRESDTQTKENSRP